MLNSLKREIGIPVEFANSKDSKELLAGEGAIPTKSMAAFD